MWTSLFIVFISLSHSFIHSFTLFSSCLFCFVFIWDEWSDFTVHSMKNNDSTPSNLVVLVVFFFFLLYADLYFIDWDKQTDIDSFHSYFVHLQWDGSRWFICCTEPSRRRRWRWKQDSVLFRRGVWRRHSFVEADTSMVQWRTRKDTFFSLSYCRFERHDGRE